MAANPNQPPPPPHLESDPGTYPHSVNRHIVEREGQSEKMNEHTPEKEKKTTMLKQAELRFKHLQKECLENAPKQLLLTAKNVSAARCY